ncbi:histidine kinase [Paenibacillus sp. GP183]|uniref:sensor histidine kinase n=1 Tax=Paenibacillus sp. GP183 TaxID=1882751 RepID=UPI000897E5D7|nr:histidine kinase [Paenibacillus sp. GP183]SEC45162.1 Histidine kinase-, DNA gyrase B-, and HSP90-like ATPase [Paenibacillus sp. GP183]
MKHLIKRTKNKPYPIRYYINMMLFIMVTALVLDCVISFAAISIVKQQSTWYLQETADLYINRIDHDFAYMNEYMGWTLVNDESLSSMETSYETDIVGFLKSNDALYKHFSELQRNYGQAYNFFIYLKKPNFMTNIAPMTLSYPDYQELKKQMDTNVENKKVYEQFSNWTLALVNDKYYIINIVPYNDRYLIGLISADDLVRPLHQLNLGENGYASLVDHNGNIFTSPISNNGEALQKDAAKTSVLNHLQSRTTVSRPFSKASFSVNMVIKFGSFEKIMIAQLLIMLLFLFITFMLGVIILYIKKRVLKPILNFSKNLTLIIEENEPMELKSSKISELEQANIKFIDLVEQIKKYKIDIYERELAKQRIQLDFMKLQIKPHFFLNCLTTIYSMAQMQMNEEIEKMTISTSKYFRYIFQNGQDFVRLQDEIEHVRIYLEIQKNRYRNAFSYRIEQAEDTYDVRIPPLILQTFIENSVKYAVPRVNKVQLMLTVSSCLEEEQETVVIQISDSGPGFSSDVLEKLTNGQSLDQTKETHIGIMNTLQRLEFLYDKKARIRFSNIENGGACVTLHLPYLAEEKI